MILTGNKQHGIKLMCAAVLLLVSTGAVAIDWPSHWRCMQAQESSCSARHRPGSAAYDICHARVVGLCKARAARHRRGVMQPRRYRPRQQRLRHPARRQNRPGRRRTY